MQILTTTNMDRLVEAFNNQKYDTALLEGSMRSGKTYSILQFIAAKCLESKLRVTVGRLRLTWIKQSLIPDFQEVMESFGKWDFNAYNKTDATYTFKNGSIIYFVGTEEPQKLQGPKQDILWLEEAIEIPESAYEQANARTTKFTILSYNPSTDKHWIYDKVQKLKTTKFIHSTYKDNPFLPQRVVDQIEKWNPDNPENLRNGTADDYLWQVYGLGLRMAPTGMIFRFNLVREIPEDVVNECYGLDFGFAADQSALVYKAEKDNDMYFKELLYQEGLTTLINPGNVNQDSLESEFKKMKVRRDLPMWCDGSRPEIIKDLKNCGYMAQGATKGSGSIEYGIQIMKEYMIHITEDSINLISEFKQYHWNDKGKPAGIDHGIDAARYAARMSCRKKPAMYDIDTGRMKTGADRFSGDIDDNRMSMEGYGEDDEY